MTLRFSILAALDALEGSATTRVVRSHAPIEVGGQVQVDMFPFHVRCSVDVGLCDMFYERSTAMGKVLTL